MYTEPVRKVSHQSSKKKKKVPIAGDFFSYTQPQLHCAYKIFFENMYSFKLFICQVGDLKPK